MSQTAIRIENIGKMYNLNHKQMEQGSLISSIGSGIKSIFSDSADSTEEFWALKDISFEVKEGDRLGIIGRNGAGKSTLLKILSRVVKPTTGRMEFYGRMASLLEVGTGFHGDLSGRENIYLNGSILGMSRREIDSRFDEIVDFSEVEQFLDTPVKRYSSGMYVRLAFAIAAHLEPDILIVDEVLAVGDAAFQKKCIGKMEEVSEKQGRTVLFVSHSITTVRSLCNTGLLLSAGKIIDQGDIHHVLNSYENQQLSTLDQKAVIREGYLFFADISRDDVFELRSIQLRNKKGEIISRVKTYDSFSLDLVFNSPRPVKLGSINVFIKSLNDIVILRFGTAPDQNLDFPFKSGLNRITLNVDRLPLPEGHFSLSVGLAIPMREWLLPVRDYALFEVEENDIFQSGYHPVSDNSLAICDYSWTMDRS